jgi:hypothetical protein
MSATFTEGRKRMAGRKKESFDSGRVELKATPAWIRRATAAAEELGFGSLSALIRFAVTKYLNETLPEPPHGKKGGKA